MKTLKEKILATLRENIESRNDGWGMVYLDNARIPEVSVHQFRAILAQLSKDGLYRTYDEKCFGEVKEDGNLASK